MIRLLTLEWLKLRHYRPFWVLLVLYFVVLGLVSCSVMFFFEYITSQGAEFEGIKPTMIPFYDFADIWQNLTYLATYFKIFLGFIVVMSITNEYDYKTVRQNIIDGLTKWEFISTKLLVILALSLATTLFMFLVGLVMGWIYSPVQGASVIFANAEFLLAYLLDVTAFLAFALLVGMLIKRTGFAIVLLAFYSLFIEPIATTILMARYPDLVLYQYFPIRAINNLISVPFAKYAFREIQDFVAVKDVIVVGVYLAGFTFLNYWLLKERDVR